MTIQRIAFISVHTSPLAPMGGKKTGGMNVYIRELAYELGQRGIMVDIFTRRSSLDEPEIDGAIGANVRVIYLKAGEVAPMKPDDLYPHLSHFTARIMAFATRYNLHYDMIYSHYWLSGWVAQKLKEATGTPFVQMFHTLGQMKQRILTHGTIFPDQRITTETLVMDWADRLIAATPAEHSQLLWLYRANRRKIEIVPPGVNMERFSPISQAEAKQKLGFEPQHNILLFVGRIEPLKAVDSIIEALAIVREKAPHLLENLRFALVGGDPNDKLDAEMQRLQRITCCQEVDDVVMFLGAKDQSELPMYYAAATAVIMPSDYESFGMVALEAMAMGTPVIASNVGGLSYLIEDGKTGYHIPAREPHVLAEGIISLVSDLDHTAQMGQNAALAAQAYAWQIIADRLLAIFNDILNKRAAQTA